MMAKEKEFMEMTFKLKLEDQRNHFEKQRRELERKHKIEERNLREELENIKRENNALKADFYRQENHVRLLQQKIREEEKNKQTQVEFSNTLCNVRR
jgi:molybdopterin-biosynthesis enzyme MoeA-like protein